MVFYCLQLMNSVKDTTTNCNMEDCAIVTFKGEDGNVYSNNSIVMPIIRDLQKDLDRSNSRLVQYRQTNHSQNILIQKLEKHIRELESSLKNCREAIAAFGIKE